jgi:hypothetical protein
VLGRRAGLFESREGTCRIGGAHWAVEPAIIGGNPPLVRAVAIGTLMPIRRQLSDKFWCASLTVTATNLCIQCWTIFENWRWPNVRHQSECASSGEARLRD